MSEAVLAGNGLGFGLAQGMSRTNLTLVSAAPSQYCQNRTTAVSVLCRERSDRDRSDRDRSDRDRSDRDRDRGRERDRGRPDPRDLRERERGGEPGGGDWDRDGRGGGGGGGGGKGGRREPPPGSRELQREEPRGMRDRCVLSSASGVAP